MKFSIIIPTYNREKFIERAIKSVLKQNFSDWEIIIVDDGSTDNTRKNIKKYLKDSRIKYFYKENGGVGSARNYGIKEAQGEFLIFLDSDDELVVEGLEIIEKTILQHKKDKIFFFGVVDVNKKKISYTRFKKSIRRVNFVYFIKEKNIRGEFLPVVLRRVFNKKNKFPENVNGGEGILWWKLIKKYQLVINNQGIRIYHFDAGDSIIRSVLNINNVNNSLLINETILSIYKKDLLSFNRKKLGIIYFNIARNKALLGQGGWNDFLLGIKYAGFNLKNIVLFFIACIDYKFFLTNIAINIVNLFKK